MSASSDNNNVGAAVRVGLFKRLGVALRLLVGLRSQDFAAAGLYVATRYPGRPFLVKWSCFVGWALRQMLVVIPNVTPDLTIARHVSATPMWLDDANPLANHPWQNDPEAHLPEEADTVVIGAGFTGAAMAYHWSKKAPVGRDLVVLEMADPADGSSGRNEGLVVMGRYFKMVHESVDEHLRKVRRDLGDAQRDRLAREFARKYCQAAYRNAELIDQAIQAEGFDCDYARAGWVQARGAADQDALAASVRMATAEGFTDWVSITAAEALEKTGMRLQHPAGFSVAAATWHPAKWVWCLLAKALTTPGVRLFTQTPVVRVADSGSRYEVQTERGTIRARHVVYATESYTPRLDRQFHDAIQPIQEQAASGDGGPESMKPYVGISAEWFFGGRYGRRVLFGSSGARVRDEQAGRNRPSRFLSRFVAAEMKRYFGPYRLHMTNEWSGTVGYTPDEYPIVGAIDGKGRYVIAGMCGSGSGVSFNAARCIANRILGLHDEPDDYPEAFFAPSRLLNPATHPWPEVEE